ncbi:unnamed protein product [Candidula unifasciata]|uniref:Serpin domain-containing protein n=1 Tax=Candidula unifasciata TaxID=100452 RepID=A0A8S3ZK74_9EUPU|nr:unnamed protein product [Candidula unifasciata]
MYYSTQVSSHNQTDPLTTEQKINDFIKNKTGGHIKDIVTSGSLSSGAEIVLANALYVFAAWKKPFKQRETSKQNFYPTTGPAIQIDMLYDSFRKVRTKYNFYGADMVELPCTGDRYSMYFLVPKYGTPLAELGKSLTTGNNSKELFEDLTEEYVEFRVPRFQVESTYELSSVLKDLGVVKAFDSGQADFRALSKTSEKRNDSYQVTEQMRIWSACYRNYEYPYSFTYPCFFKR